MSKDSTRQISSEIVSKYYLEDVEPPVFEYIIWLSCDIKDEECSYKFRIITYPTERNDSSVILLKLKSGETVTLYPYYYMKSVNYYTLPYGYLNHEYTDYYLEYALDEQTMFKIMNGGITKIRIGSNKPTKFDEYLFKNNKFSIEMKSAYNAIQKKMKEAPQNPKTIYDNF